MRDLTKLRLHAMTVTATWIGVQIYYMGANYRRALCLLRNSGLIETDANYRYLAAKCLAEVKEWEECLCLLEEAGEETSQVS